MLVGGILIGGGGGGVDDDDDTIHFAHHFARYRSESGCSYRAIRETLVTSGRAMLATSTILSIGFFSFMGASLQNISDFGLYCGAGVILAFLADVVLFARIDHHRIAMSTRMFLSPGRTRSEKCPNPGPRSGS